MMNTTPKYTGSMSAALTMGMNTGVKINTMGMKSSTMPAKNTTTIMAVISTSGRSEMVCSQAPT